VTGDRAISTRSGDLVDVARLGDDGAASRGGEGLSL